MGNHWNKTRRCDVLGKHFPWAASHHPVVDSFHITAHFKLKKKKSLSWFNTHTEALRFDHG